MLYTYSNTTQTLTSGSPALFNTNGVLTGCTVTHSAGTASVSLNKPGLYYVTVNAVGTSTVAGTNIGLGLYNNDTLVTGTQTTSTVPVANGFTTIPINTIIRVLPNCCVQNGNVPATLTVVNTSGASEAITNITLTVTKVG